jgi:hypothetical protein
VQHQPERSHWRRRREARLPSLVGFWRFLSH